MNGPLPKVSCLVVTADRPRLLRRSLLSYQAQTYPNKELVVVDDGRDPLDELLSELPTGPIRYIRLEKKPENTLGRLRNLSLEAATGDCLTIWDDDDWYHPDRLKIQVAALVAGNDSCLLSSALFHLDAPGYFDHPFRSPFRKGVPGSLVFVRDPSIHYPELRRGEDSVFLKAWRRRPQKKLETVYAYLQVRCYHGTNTWDYGHFIRRLKSSPRDAAAYAWYRYARRDVWRHPGFTLEAKDQESFRLYLEDSRRAGLFPEEGRR